MRRRGRQSLLSTSCELFSVHPLSRLYSKTRPTRFSFPFSSSHRSPATHVIGSEPSEQVSPPGPGPGPSSQHPGVVYSTRVRDPNRLKRVIGALQEAWNWRTILAPVPSVSRMTVLESNFPPFGGVSVNVSPSATEVGATLTFAVLSLMLMVTGEVNPVVLADPLQVNLPS